MMKNRITDLLAYRWRYVLGYSFIVVVIFLMLVVAAFYIPHELRAGEVESALTSASLGASDMAPKAVIDLPYHILQKLSIMVFGVSVMSIKLPSIILGALTVFGIFLLIRTWFQANVAILATLLCVVTAQFLFLTQDGTPGIMFAFNSVWLLFVATFVTRRKYFGLFWKVLACLAMAMSLYTPMGIYLVLVMLTTAMFHPHIRYLIRRFNKTRVALAVVLGIAALVPLGYAIFLDISIAATILGIPTSPIDIVANAVQVFQSMVGLPAATTSYLVQPLYTIGLVLLMLVGLYRIVTHSYTARSYITVAWGAVLIVLLILNPGSVTDFYPVAVILISYGMIEMIRSWYRIFPHNPYARVAGMVPLVVLVLALVFSGSTRYIGTYRNNPDVLKYYSSDLTLFRRTLANQHAQANTTVVVTSASELPFYQLINKYDHRFTVTSTPGTTGSTTIVTRAATRPTTPPSQIVVNARATDSDRFYVYKK